MRKTLRLFGLAGLLLGSFALVPGCSRGAVQPADTPGTSTEDSDDGDDSDEEPVEDSDDGDMPDDDK